MISALTSSVLGFAKRLRRSTHRALRRRLGPALGPLPPMPGALALGAEEERALRRVIRSQRLTRSGNPWNTKSEAEELEKRLAACLGTRRSLVVSSGTAALHCALVGLGIGPGDEVIVPAYTWVATAAAVCIAGAVPVIADIDETLTLDPNVIEALITPFTRAILVVHMRGAPARMNRIAEIARRHGIAVIEDVAQAMGGRFRGQPLGTLGDVGCFSMQTYKLMCVGEGGAVVARDPDVFERIRAFRGETGERAPLLSLNYNMSELAAAVGCVQLARSEPMLARMRAIKARLLECLHTVAARRPLMLRGETDADGDSATCVTWFEPTPAAAQRACAALRAAGIGSSRGYQPGVPDLHVFRHWEAIMRQRPLSAGGGPWRHANRPIAYSSDMCPRAIDLLSRAVEVAVLPQYRDRDVSRMTRSMQSVLTSIPEGEPDVALPTPAALRPAPSRLHAHTPPDHVLGRDRDSRPAAELQRDRRLAADL